MKIYHVVINGPDGEEGNWYTAQKAGETDEQVVARIQAKVFEDGDTNPFADGPAELTCVVHTIDTERETSGELQHEHVASFTFETGNDS